MNKILKITLIILGIVLALTGCSKQTLGTKENQDQTNDEKLQRIIKSKEKEQLDKKETVDLYGFEIPCYIIDMEESPAIVPADTSYPQMTWNPKRNMLTVYLNVKNLENGGDTYQLENLLKLKFDKKTVASLMKEFNQGDTKTIGFEDETYIIFSTATDDTRIVTIGDIVDRPGQKEETP